SEGLQTLGVEGRESQGFLELLRGPASNAATEQLASRSDEVLALVREIADVRHDPEDGVVEVDALKARVRAEVRAEKREGLLGLDGIQEDEAESVDLVVFAVNRER